MSDIGSIRAVIKSQLEAMLDGTSAAWFDGVFDELNQETMLCPVAHFVIGGAGNLRPDYNALIDADHELQIWIEAETLAKCEDILKDVQGLWIDNDNMAAIRDVGVINVIPTDITVPVPIEGENRYNAVAVFTLHVRYDYT